MNSARPDVVNQAAGSSPAAFFSASRTISADTLTPIAAFAELATPGASCLLESVESAGGRISRYSFLGIDYIDAAEFDATPSLITSIREFVRRHAVDETGCELPLGGALVAFSYDAARPYARLRPRESGAPRMPAAYVAIPQTWIVFDHFTDRVTIWTRGALGPENERRIQGYIDRLMQMRPRLPQPVRASGPMQASLDRDAYLQRVATVQQYILDGEVYQLQLGIRFCARMEGTAFDLYRTVRSRNPSPYMFYVDAPFGQLLGASPEFLVRLEGTQARIRPLAGTRPRGNDELSDIAIAQELLRNEKERAEHVMLVDLGRNDLGRVCAFGSVRATELLQIERYSHVMHIVSDLVGELRTGCDGLDVFQAGFPAGTVTGTPKIRAMQLIDELEPLARGFYAGSVGRLSFAGDFDSCITLRSIHVAHGTATWQASAGIVADSDPQAEYEEVFHKTRIAREALGIEEPSIKSGALRQAQDDKLGGDDRRGRDDELGRGGRLV
ncbi:MAG TPA: anthranilate synthase component I family protein [Candidatus Baltobacteraceae bacterium]|nr:anthranilate synthase component I family protein [Candidatus Baltobacteraceae bacterium]